MVTTALGLAGYALLVLAAAMVAPALGVAALGVVLLYLAYANAPRRGA